jgi:hypothetical protein
MKGINKYDSQMNFKVCFYTITISYFLVAVIE